MSLLMLLCLAASVHAVVETATDGYVVWLHSYHPADWSDALQRGIRDGLGPAVPLRIEFMDTKRRSDAAYLAALTEVYRLKYTGQPVRTVIASDDDAIRFAIAHRDDLFGGAPIAWCGVNHYEPALLADGHATGAIEVVDAEATLDLAFRLRPKAEAIHIICDDTNTGQVNLAAIRTTLAERHPDRQVEVVGGLSLSQLSSRLASLPADDVAFFVAFWRDGDGQAVEPDQLAPAIRGSACPVLGRNAWMVGRGILGGLCVTGEAHGRIAGTVASRLLAGEQPGSIRVTTAANVWLFDANALGVHGIDETDLPAGSEIRFRPRSLLREHPLQALAGIVAVVMLAGLAAALGVAVLRLRRAEGALAAERRVLAAVIDQSMQFMGILDAEGRVLLVNQSALELVGVNQTDLIGRPFWETRWWSHDMQQSNWLRESIQRIAAGGQAERRLVSHRAESGEMRSIDFSIKAARLPDGELRIIPEGRDVTDLIEARDRLVESEARFRQLAEHIDAVFWLYDRSTDRILYVSRSCDRIWGIAAEDLLRKPSTWIDAIHVDDRERVARLYACPEANVWSAEYRTVRRDGSVRVIRVRGFPVARAPGRMAGIAEDITDMRRFEEEARQAQRLQLLRQLAGGVAHDFNNALAGILGNAELALVDVALPSGAAQRLRTIVATAARAGTVTRQLLAFARVDVPERRRFELRQVVSDAVALIRPALTPGTVLEWTPSSEPTPIYGDPGLVQNAVLNLLINARDAIQDRSDGGRIQVTCGIRQVVTHDPVQAAWRLAPGNYAEVAVCDNGSGIDAAVRDRIFEPFFTTKKNGAGNGLGLAAVHGTVSGHGGAVLVDAMPAAGTRFRLLLPIADGLQPQLTPVPAPSSRILVADDDPVVREVTAQLLRAMGHSTEQACDGVEAVQRVASGGFDLVILDMIMPRMDGREALARIRDLDPALPVLLLTGWASTGGDELIKAGATAVLAKPLSASDLARQIALALSRAQRR